MMLVYILLAAVLVKCVLLYKLYSSVPVLELKRRARMKDKRAVALYKVASYESALDVLLWILGIASAVTLFIWSARTAWWLAAVVMVLTAWLVIWAPAPKPDGWAGALASLSARYQAALLSFLNPLLSRLGSWLPPAKQAHFHTGLYEKNDLLELLSKQNKQLDNRIAESDLRIAGGAMTFGDKVVSSVMTPRRQVKLVAATESVGPLLMDELHQSGHSRFPVVKDSTKSVLPQFAGTLYLRDVVGFDGTAKVKDLARKDVYFINEDSDLRQALDAFLKTHHHLLIVVNSFEEMVGVLSIEDVFEQIIGKPIIDEFDSYENLQAVAAKEAKKDYKNHNEVPVAPKTE
ncbi:CBS domain-containing protein [Candidatus Saccharibacteria bacterium]|nr:CBS domain-containing protein [Candidatus Saccharibacteria bacterium]